LATAFNFKFRNLREKQLVLVYISYSKLACRYYYRYEGKCDPVAAEVYKQFHNKQLYMNPLLSVIQIIQMSDTG
jgi:hypothetical protein